MYLKELNKNYQDKEELFKDILENEKLIIDSKKSEVYKSIDKGLYVINNQSEIKKAIETETIKGLKFDNDYYYFVVNSANILDSHLDMHVDGNWNKTVKEQQGKVYLVFDHKLERSEVIAMAEDIELIATKIPFSLLGKNYEGDTYSLIYKVAKDKIINKQAKEWLELGYNLKASVRMQYVKIETAMNSNNLEYAKQKTTFDTYYPLIANKNDFETIDYFWVVKEAKNVQESSLVLFPSNPATGRISNEQSKDTQETIQEEQVKTTQTKETVLIF